MELQIPYSVRAEIQKAETCSNHIHMLLPIPPKYSVSSVMGYLKGKSSLMSFGTSAGLRI